MKTHRAILTTDKLRHWPFGITGNAVKSTIANWEFEPDGFGGTWLWVHRHEFTIPALDDLNPRKAVHPRILRRLKR